jgi:NADH-ubiquinone oxidoreductase chain 4
MELYELSEDQDQVENSFNLNNLNKEDNNITFFQAKIDKIHEILNIYLLNKSGWRSSLANSSDINMPISVGKSMLISTEDLNSNWRSLRYSGCLASIHFYAACSIYYITQNEMVTNYHNISDNGNFEDKFLNETRSYNIRLGWDSLSKIFVLLVGFIFTFAFIANWSNIELLGIKGKSFILNLVGMEFLLIIVFLVTNMLLFYIFFESILPGLFLLVGIYGAQQKIKAAFYLFLYTLFGSLFMLLVLLKLYADGASLDMRKSIDSNLTKDWSIVGWMGLIFAFAVKTPLVPVHTWLPLAHSDANVSGSIILASVVLKLALYGILRLLIGILIAGVILIPTMLSWASLSTGYASLTTIRQFDLKVLVAYSSVAHMGSTLIGAFSNEFPGIFGSILFGLAHGVVSPGLFILVGAVLYDRSGSRNIIYYRGLTLLLPIFAVCFLLLVFGNMGVPLTGNFLGEFLSYLGAYQENVFIVSIAALSIIFSAVYSIYMYNRVMSGSLSPYVHIIPDVFRKEFAIILPLLFATFLLGIYPYFISYDIEYGLSSILLFSPTWITLYKRIEKKRNKCRRIPKFYKLVNNFKNSKEAKNIIASLERERIENEFKSRKMWVKFFDYLKGWSHNELLLFIFLLLRIFVLSGLLFYIACHIVCFSYDCFVVVSPVILIVLKFLINELGSSLVNELLAFLFPGWLINILKIFLGWFLTDFLALILPKWMFDLVQAFLEWLGRGK